MDSSGRYVQSKGRDLNSLGYLVEGLLSYRNSLLPLRGIAKTGGSLHLWLFPLCLFLLILKLYLFRVSNCSKLIINMLITWKQGSWGSWGCLEFTLVCSQEHLWTQGCLWVFLSTRSVTCNFSLCYWERALKGTFGMSKEIDIYYIFQVPIKLSWVF